jgi:hypothetical protein
MEDSQALILMSDRAKRRRGKLRKLDDPHLGINHGGGGGLHPEEVPLPEDGPWDEGPDINMNEPGMNQLPPDPAMEHIHNAWNELRYNKFYVLKVQNAYKRKLYRAYSKCALYKRLLYKRRYVKRRYRSYGKYRRHGYSKYRRYHKYRKKGYRKYPRKYRKY